MGAPIPGAPPSGYANSDERTWALLAHAGGIFLGFIAPLVVLLAKGNESPTVRAHALEALNFQITWGAAALLTSILTVCAGILTFGIGGVLIILPIGCGIMIVVFSLVAAIKASDGVFYTYPASLRLVK
ncbi:MAG TPA: DUF4870 domain-containing protein [Micromonosporaceae bacterium]|jgi:hypothetical protein